MQEKAIAALNNAATLLIQLEATDSDGLEELKDTLETMALEGGLPPFAQARTAGAARAVGRALADQDGEALAEAGRLIGEILEASDGPPQAAPAAAPKPEPALAHEADSVASEVETDLEEPWVEGTPEAGWETPPAPLPAVVEEAADGEATVVPAVDSEMEVDMSLFGDFVTESREYMEEAEASLLELEGDPENSEAINTVFRAFHTIKGTSGFLGLATIAELAHHAESLFNRFRDGELRCTGSWADLSLRSVDGLSALLTAAEAAIQGDGMMTLPDGFHDLMRILEDPEAAGVGGDEPPELPQVAEPAPARGPIKEESPDKAPAATATPASKPTKAPVQTVTKAADTSDSSVRVRTDRLDELINMVGELVIAHSMLAQDKAVVFAGDADLSRKVGHAGKIVRELQDLSVSMRMVPLKGTFQKMARLVRDLARKSGKEIEFVVEGEDTEIDRNMVDVIGDPLVHMIRNAVDHGIELPEVRKAAGKPPAGTIRLAAFHAGGNVVVELTDDGKGLNRETILNKAIQKGLVEADRSLADNEILELIFAPGFSTAEQVTDLSGRGVGMDVVKRNIEELRGRVEIGSELGNGTVFTIRLPLTLAVTDGMLVQVAGERYIIPTASIQQSFRPAVSSLSTVIGSGEMATVRGEVLPILRLHQLFGIQGAQENPSEGLLVIVGAGTHRCAVLVDELVGQHQAVAKPLGEGIGRVRGVAGGAILGDGKVGLILDVAELVTVARESGVINATAA